MLFIGIAALGGGLVYGVIAAGAAADAVTIISKLGMRRRRPVPVPIENLDLNENMEFAFPPVSRQGTSLTRAHLHLESPPTASATKDPGHANADCGHSELLLGGGRTPHYVIGLISVVAAITEEFQC